MGVFWIELESFLKLLHRFLDAARARQCRGQIGPSPGAVGVGLDRLPELLGRELELAPHESLVAPLIVNDLTYRRFAGMLEQRIFQRSLDRSSPSQMVSGLVQIA